MKKLLAILALALSACATVPSGPKIVDVASPPGRPEWRANLYDNKGKVCEEFGIENGKRIVLEGPGASYEGCYVRREDGGAVFVLEDGVPREIPKEDFESFQAKQGAKKRSGLRDT